MRRKIRRLSRSWLKHNAKAVREDLAVRLTGLSRRHCVAGFFFFLLFFVSPHFGTVDVYVIARLALVLAGSVRGSGEPSTNTQSVQSKIRSEIPISQLLRKDRNAQTQRR